MYTLDIKKNNIIYLIISIFCGVFSYVYELFSHQVYSPFMIFPGVVTLFLGIIITTILRDFHNIWSYRFYNSGVACVIVGMYIKGVLDIYGTTNHLLGIYFIVSIIFFVLFLVALIVSSFKKIKKIIS